MRRSDAELDTYVKKRVDEANKILEQAEEERKINGEEPIAVDRGSPRIKHLIQKVKSCQ